MTQPSGDQGQQQAPAKAKAKVKVLDVVEYTHRDRILGGSRQHVGVVVAVGDGDDAPLTIRPLAEHSVQVEPGDVAGAYNSDDL